ncbi:MAG: amino acid permease [Burkholderiales bacterium]|nr:amino acid permease [Burkholderiales bacterium]
MSEHTGAAGTPARVLSVKDVVMLAVGVVVGAGIFKAPSLVAGATSSEAMLIFAWILGGAITMIGALTYAELASTFPSAGGDYHFLNLAYGRRFAFLFAWARATVITTGSIALLAFVFGDYCAQLFPIGPYSSPFYACLVVIVLSAIHWISTRASSTTQNWLTVLEVGGLVLVAIAGFVATPSAAAPAPAVSGNAAFGFAMVMVLLTFGGWNEVAYVSAEMSSDKRGIARALIISILVVTAIYLLVNLAYLNALGQAGMAKSNAVAADVLKAAFGDWGARAISVIVAIATLTSINSTLIVGARSSYAAGRDWPALRFLGSWSAQGSTPRHALLVQMTIAIALIILGTMTRKGFETMVDYTAPVFWFFFLLAGLSVFVLRARYPDAERPFRVPLYPVLPALFCCACAWLLYSSLAYVKTGAMFGLGLLAVGAVVSLFLGRPSRRS